MICLRDRNGTLTHAFNSTNSIDDILNGEDVDIPADAWKSELHSRIEQIVDRKRSSAEGRADSLNAFAHILMARYAKDEIEGHMNELLPSILRSIRSETTERETVTALKGMQQHNLQVHPKLTFHSACRCYRHPRFR